MKLERDDSCKSEAKPERPATPNLVQDVHASFGSNTKVIDVYKAEQRECIQLFTPPDTPVATKAPARPVFTATSCQHQAQTRSIQVNTRNLIFVGTHQSANHVHSEAKAPAAQASPFLGLPLHIPIRICGYILGGKEYHIHIPKGKREPICALEDGHTDRQILSMCKQIHSETKLLPFNLNVFYVWPHTFNRWLNAETLTTGQEESISQLRFNWPEVQEVVGDELAWFWGLKTVHVTYVPDGSSVVQFRALVEALRSGAERKDLRVVFWRNGIGGRMAAMFT